MERLKIFKPQYAEQLKKEVANGIELQRYGQEYFPFDEKMLIPLVGISEIGGVVSSLSPLPEDDIKSAKIIYQALDMLNPLQASYNVFWESLSHLDLFSYVQKRWPRVKENAFDDKQYILDHWFVTKRPMRHPIAGLWWSVNQTIDENNKSNPYYLTEYLFKHFDFRTRRLGASTLFRYKPAVHGILKFMSECDEINESYFEGRANYIIMYFNQMGAVRQLASLPKEFFYDELNRIKGDILRIQYREEVAGALLDME